MPLDIATKHARFTGRLLMLGCGSIGQGVLPLLLRHIDMPHEKISILTSDTRGSNSIDSPPRVAVRDNKSIARSAYCNEVAALERPARRPMAATRASSSAKENGFTK